MSWELQVEIDMNDLSEAAGLAESLIEVVGPSLQKLRCRQFGAGWHWQNEPTDDHHLDPAKDNRAFLADIVKTLTNADQYVQFSLGVGIDDTEPHFRPISVYVFGTKHIGLSGARRRCDAMIDFGNRKRFAGQDRLITGELADEELLIRWLTQLCDKAQPRSLFVGAEETVSIPLNYHMVYHDSAAQYHDDLIEIAQLSLHGGGCYDDGRSQYDALIAGDCNPMLFAKRHGARLQQLLASLLDNKPVLEALLDGLEIPDQLIEEVVMDDYESMQVMDTKNGLGVSSLPFLHDYCEYVYLELLNRLGPLV